jgi:hypothetical protein
VAIYVYTAPADLRKGFDGLSGIVRDKFQADPLADELGIDRDTVRRYLSRHLCQGRPG